MTMVFLSGCNCLITSVIPSQSSKPGRGIHAATKMTFSLVPADGIRQAGHL
jgi:uncharacterized protein YceK